MLKYSIVITTTSVFCFVFNCTCLSLWIHNLFTHYLYGNMFFRMPLKIFRTTFVLHSQRIRRNLSHNAYSIWLLRKWKFFWNWFSSVPYCRLQYLRMWTRMTMLIPGLRGIASHFWWWRISSATYSIWVLGFRTDPLLTSAGLKKSTIWLQTQKIIAHSVLYSWKIAKKNIEPN